ncbi:hypothetical protein DDR33_11475 [Pararcticibacter amylolyticus]|uniref:Uncharacterized protein n=1 Tax=Pararcticibacter amylolyticus TaxID=2173175 RepID=A0A2U2PGV3_9SPHI|nr:hypothetical protein DDR33_11475 [Pararcticibacter amylolyticus]
MFMPMAGPLSILLLLQRGYYDEKALRRMIENDDVFNAFVSGNKITAILYFGAVMISTISPLFYKLEKRTKYLIGIVCCLISLFVILIPRLLGVFF